MFLDLKVSFLTALIWASKNSQLFSLVTKDRRIPSPKDLKQKRHCWQRKQGQTSTDLQLTEWLQLWGIIAKTPTKRFCWCRIRSTKLPVVSSSMLIDQHQLCGKVLKELIEGEICANFILFMVTQVDHKEPTGEREKSFKSNYCHSFQVFSIGKLLVLLPPNLLPALLFLGKSSWEIIITILLIPNGLCRSAWNWDWAKLVQKRRRRSGSGTHLRRSCQTGRRGNFN